MLNRIIGRSWTALAWSTIIFILLVLPGRSLPESGMLGKYHLDKFVHAFLFGAFVYLWFAWYRTASRSNSQLIRAAVILFVVGALYGTGMEFYQEYFTTREFETGDIIADSLGAAIGTAWCIWAKK